MPTAELTEVGLDGYRSKLTEVGLLDGYRSSRSQIDLAPGPRLYRYWNRPPMVILP
jgi:hypothetical protein